MGEFLKRNWPSIRKVLDYCIRHDANEDGLIEDRQPNTYDIDFFGANTFVGSLYLAALRAGRTDGD
jgi:non-lysosomal glucosylceramidase